MLDDIIRNQVQNDLSSFDPDQHWDGALALLDDDIQKRKRKRRAIWWILFGLGLLGTAIYVGVQITQAPRSGQDTVVSSNATGSPSSDEDIQLTETSSSSHDSDQHAASRTSAEANHMASTRSSSAGNVQQSGSTGDADANAALSSTHTRSSDEIVTTQMRGDAQGNQPNSNLATQREAGSSGNHTLSSTPDHITVEPSPRPSDDAPEIATFDGERVTTADHHAISVLPDGSSAAAISDDEIAVDHADPTSSGRASSHSSVQMEAVDAIPYGLLGLLSVSSVADQEELSVSSPKITQSKKPVIHPMANSLSAVANYAVLPNHATSQAGLGLLKDVPVWRFVSLGAGLSLQRTWGGLGQTSMVESVTIDGFNSTHRFTAYELKTRYAIALPVGLYAHVGSKHSFGVSFVGQWRLPTRATRSTAEYAQQDLALRSSENATPTQLLTEDVWYKEASHLSGSIQAIYLFHVKRRLSIGATASWTLDTDQAPSYGQTPYLGAQLNLRL